MPGSLVASRSLRERLVVASVMLVIALAVSLSDALVRVDHLIFDLGQRLARTPPAADLVLVTVDEDSLGRLGRWPWPRETHARLLNTLCAAGPAAVGLDIAFSEPQLPVADAALAAAVRRCGNVVLPLVIETAGVGRQIVESPPILLLRDAAAGLGRVGIRIDEDGMVRGVDLYEGLGVAAWPLFAWELLRVAGMATAPSGREEGALDSYGLVQHGRRRIQFAGSPGTFTRLSYIDVLEGRATPALIAGRTVIVGATAVGLGDLFPTPVSAQAQPMAGVEIQANVWSGLRSGTLVRDVDPAYGALIVGLLALAPLLWLPRLMPSAALVASLLWLAVPVLLSLGTQIFLQWWFSPMGAVLAGLLAYPLWSWQRLEAARRHLDSELRELRGALPEAPGADTAFPSAGEKGFEQRIAWVQSARQRVQDLEAQRREILAFISHDLRSPLASVVQRLENDPECTPAQLLPSLLRAQTMAQDFLRLARAEALERRDMKTLDLVSVLHQAADELYAAAHSRRMRIERRLPDDPVWIVADFEAVERCAINLLQNAVTHGLAGSPIILGLDLEPHSVRFWVENDGAQVDAVQLTHLFEKFRRGGVCGRGDCSAGGAGLGLYYVRTVAGRHGGQAGAESSGGTIRFWVALPSAVQDAKLDDPGRIRVH